MKKFLRSVFAVSAAIGAFMIFTPPPAPAEVNVNIGVNLQVLPVTGLTLPFVSYGGSSLMANMMGIGLVESVIVHHRALD